MGADVIEKKARPTRRRQKKRRNCETVETRKAEAGKKTFPLEKGNNLNGYAEVLNGQSN